MAYGFPLQKSYNITNQLTFQGSKFSGREIDIPTAIQRYTVQKKSKKHHQWPIFGLQHPALIRHDDLTA